MRRDGTPYITSLCLEAIRMAAQNTVVEVHG